MKAFKARREREQHEAIVRPSITIQDPSAELFSESRPWDSDDPLQDSFLDQTNLPQSPKTCPRIPKLKFRKMSNTFSSEQWPSTCQENILGTGDTNELACNVSQEGYSDEQPQSLFDLSPMDYDASPEAVIDPWLSGSLELSPPAIPERHPEHVASIPIRSRSLPAAQRLLRLSVSPPKTDFQVFSQRCAPSPVSASPTAITPVFELPAREVAYTVASAFEPESPVELDGSPVESKTLYPAPLDVLDKYPSEPEPEASPYNRFTSYIKSIHALNVNLAPIVETEEEAASRRSSAAQIYELPSTESRNSLPTSAYTGGTSITPRNHHRAFSTPPESTVVPSRNVSTRSSDSATSSASLHSVFSFEFSNSDTEKIYVSTPMDRRESSAPSLTDVSSVDDFDVDIELDAEARRGRSISRRDAKLERFFGIRQYSVSTEPGLSPTTETPQAPSTSSDTLPGMCEDSEPPSQPSHRHSRSLVSIDDLDLSLVLEHDPYKRELMTLHKSILYKSQSKQDAKLEKFFGCDKDEIQIARKSSTGIRLAGNNDDLKYRSIGW